MLTLFVASLTGGAEEHSAEDENMLLHQLVSRAMHEYREGKYLERGADLGWMRSRAALLGRCHQEKIRKMM